MQLLGNIYIFFYYLCKISIYLQVYFIAVTVIQFIFQVKKSKKKERKKERQKETKREEKQIYNFLFAIRLNYNKHSRTGLCEIISLCYFLSI